MWPESSDAFFEGTEKYLVGCKNAKKSKKSQALLDDKGDGSLPLQGGCWTEGVFHLLRWAVSGLD
jgi:hypothetical protein